MTSVSVRLQVLATAPPQPASKALAMTRALVLGGPLPMTYGLAKRMPLTVIPRSTAMVFLRGRGPGLRLSRPDPPAQAGLSSVQWFSARHLDRCRERT